MPQVQPFITFHTARGIGRAGLMGAGGACNLCNKKVVLFFLWMRVPHGISLYFKEVRYYSIDSSVYPEVMIWISYVWELWTGVFSIQARYTEYLHSHLGPGAV